jgi:hypothetical protein
MYVHPTISNFFLKWWKSWLVGGAIETCSGYYIIKLNINVFLVLVLLSSSSCDGCQNSLILLHTRMQKE